MTAAKKIKSEISWAVFHPDDIEEARKVIKAFQGDGTIDAMGFGVLLEEISDLLFPGTSTLHTWLRYQIFIPALIQALLESKKKHDPRTALLLLELELQKTLVRTAENSKDGAKTVGIIGKNKGEQLKYWPSMVYWNSLNTLHSFGKEKLARDKAFNLISLTHGDHATNDEGEGEISVDETLRVDADLCKIAEEAIFKDISKGTLRDKLDFRLTMPEAKWFAERFRSLFPKSVSSHLIDSSAEQIEKTKSVFSIKLAKNSPTEKLLQESEKYSRFAQGATYLYNAVLCEHKEKGGATKHNLLMLDKWLDSATFLKSWSADQIYEALQEFQQGKAIQKDDAFIAFCSELQSLFDKGSVEKVMAGGRKVIQERELRVKGARSRFRNNRVNVPRNIYDTESTFDPHLFNYRWGVGQSNAMCIAERLKK